MNDDDMHENTLTSVMESAAEPTTNTDNTSTTESEKETDGTDPTEPSKESGNMNEMLDVIQVYVDYLELAKTDWGEACLTYCHYEVQEDLQLTLDSNELLLEYELLRCQKLSDQLWEIELFAITTNIRYGAYAVNYVGFVDGCYRVMPAIKQIPAELKEGVTIEPYEPHGPGIVDPDDVFGGPEDEFTQPAGGDKAYT